MTAFKTNILAASTLIYQKFFVDAMKKFNVKSPADFKDAKKKQEFFDFVDANYKGKHE